MIRLCSYNIHGAVGGLDRQYKPQRIIRVIQAIQADIYGLQEVRQNHEKDNLLDLLRQQANGNILFLKTLTDRKGDYGNALISRFPITRHFDIELDIDPEKNGRMAKIEARRAIVAQLQIKPDGFLWVIVTHLAVERAARHLQFEKIIDLIQEKILIKKEACILMGDMNEWSRPVYFIRELDKIFGKQIIHPTFPAVFPLLPLDRMWISRKVQLERSWVFRGKGARLASDHRPICSEINA